MRRLKRIGSFISNKKENLMPGLNRVQLIGRLGKDPDARFTPTGKKVVKFSLAVSNRWKKDGEIKEYTEWVNIEAWGGLGEICHEYLHKGSLVYLEGRLKTDKYQDASETTRYYTKVVVQQLQMLDRKADVEAEMVEEAPAEYDV
jgi:single-strand DNA-binding protein